MLLSVFNAHGTMSKGFELNIDFGHHITFNVGFKPTISNHDRIFRRKPIFFLFLLNVFSLSEFYSTVTFLSALITHAFYILLFFSDSDNHFQSITCLG